MIPPERSALVASLRAFVQAEQITPDPAYVHWNSGLYSVLDCVYSSQARYAQVVLPLLRERFPVATGLKDVPDLPFSAFLDSVGAALTPERLEAYATQTMRTRQKIAGRLKVEVVYDVCQFFVRRGFETRADLLALGEEVLEPLVLTDLVGEVRGIGPVLARYLLLLLGLERHVKPDTLLTRLLGRIGGWLPRAGHEGDMNLIREVVTAVADELGTTPALLDHALWMYESTGMGKSASPEQPPETLTLPSSPRTMNDPAVRKHRRTLLTAPHHAPLHAYVHTLISEVQVQDLDVPEFDPLGGGVHARILCLLEAPGPKAAARLGGSGFISIDNDDPTAHNMFTLTQLAGVPREWFLAWNIVPWYVGSGDRIRPVQQNEIAIGREHLRALLTLLPELRVVVTLGRPAADGWAELAPAFPHLATLTTWHPSGQALNPHPERRAHLQATLNLARQLVAHADDSRAPTWASGHAF